MRVETRKKVVSCLPTFLSLLLIGRDLRHLIFFQAKEQMWWITVRNQNSSVGKIFKHGLKTTPPRIYDQFKIAPPTTTTSKWGKGLISRLQEQGDLKLIKLYSNHIHIEPTRFIDPINQIKGLLLKDAMAQLKWDKRPISKLLQTELIEHSIKLKQDGFDLQKTWVAHSYVTSATKGLQPRFIKLVKGRGRYGSTPHAKFARLEWIFQQRERGFAKKENDPLEKIREKLRSKYEVDLEKIVQEKMESKVVLEIKPE